MIDPPTVEAEQPNKLAGLERERVGNYMRVKQLYTPAGINIIKTNL